MYPIILRYLKLGDAAVYIPQERSSAVLPNVTGETVVVLDYCFSREVTEAMIVDTGGRFIVLDHHNSALHDLMGIPDENKVFVMGQSGATLSWNFFFPGQEIPLWLRYVEDKDIWRWALRDSHAFTAGFSLLPQTFEVYAKLHNGGHAAVDDIIERGAFILEYQNGVVASHVKQAKQVKLRVAATLTAAVVNSSTLGSEMGNAMCTQIGVDIGIVWSYDHRSKQFRVSLRSIDGDKADVSIIAKKFGGGGHKCAAAFAWKGSSIEELFL